MNEKEKQERLLRLMEEEQKVLHSGDESQPQVNKPADSPRPAPSAGGTLDQPTYNKPKPSQRNKESEILNWLKETEQKRAKDRKETMAVLRQIASKKTVGLDPFEKIAFMFFMILTTSFLSQILKGL
jgi:hypothetical protein